MMRAILVGVLAIGSAASLALATGSTDDLTEPVRNTLTTIDKIPTREQLDTAFEGEPALSSLSTIAKNKSVDVGVRLRAIHALAKYCTAPCAADDVAHTSLTQLIGETQNETVGEPVILLRAAIETIGVLRVDEDVLLLRPLLDHPSRDIRAATARALRDLCNSQAVTPLRVRYTSEPTEQVKLAISEALRILGQCGN